MSWASEQAALETDGARRVLVLEIDLSDPSGYLPDSTPWTASKTLYLSDQFLKRTSSGDAALTVYQAAVTDWGTISTSGSPSTAFESTGDVQITLSNAAIQLQEPVSNITGPTALSPEPVGEEIRLLELVRLYNWEGSAVRIKVLTIGSYTTDQADGDFEGQLTTIFTGEIAEVDATHDALVLDITQTDKAQRSTLPGREITDSFDESANGSRAPIVYGDWRDHDDLLGGFTDLEALRIGYQHPCTPALPFTKTSTGFDYIVADFAGIGITSQPDYGAGDYTTSEDIIFRHHPDTGAFSVIESGTSAGQTKIVNDTGGGSNAELLLRANQYLQGYCYLPCREIYGSNGTVTNPENMVDGDPTTHGTLSLSSTANYIDFVLPDVGRYGEVNYAADAVVSYILLKADTASTGECQHGLWRQVSTAAYIGGSPSTLAAATITSGGYDYQSIGISAYVRSDGSGTYYDEPPLDWRWQYSDGSGNYGGIVLRLKVTTAEAAKTISVVGCGVRVYYRMAKATDGVKHLPPITTNHGGGRHTGSRGAPASIPVVGDVTTSIYAMIGKSTIDDASGTVTGTGEATIEHPIDIANHLLRAWCRDTAGTDLVTATSTFGTFASTAKTRFNRWIGVNVAGGTSLPWKCAWTISADTTVADALKQLCAETPMMIQRDPATGKFYCVVYEDSTLAASAQDWEKFQDADGNVVTFHPNYFDPRGLTSDKGRPYSVREFGTRSGGRENRYTDIRVRFRRFAPTGAFLDSVYANPDGQKVWSETAGAYVEGASGTLYDACTLTEDLMGRRTEEYVVEAVTIQDPATATGLLWYLTTILSGQAVRVRGYTNAEGCTLKPGHVFQVSNDMNLHNPLPWYGGADWEDVYFYCTKVDTSFQGSEPIVYFEGLQWLFI